MTVAAFHPVRPASLLSAVGPFLALAALAFLAGFGGYLILGPANVLDLTAGPAAAHASAATPADVAVTPDADAPNPPKAV
ncbi:MAG TPA: hypothetical protein VNW53_04620 [Phenylobacterium sp.]|jgi:hypothetical protein|uniref:hypothetical protein n=1 Tax=Phenylobacterium sp. TaxID=1871053 RepID=UPI002C138719|nr:hypothetical protein [Phenylobacterium sp.]HXA38262.1 hypothetical protein [Phenylobacterium sp.]